MIGFLLSLFFGFAPMFFFAWFVYWLDRYEKEPKILLGVVFIWGAVVAAGVAFVINTVLGLGVYLMTGSEAITEIATGSMVAPPVEEILKGLAVLLVFWVFRHEFDSVLDGIVYAGIVALGFAATENAFYIYTFGYQEGGYAGLFYLVFVRVILVGWQHPFYTSFFGIGLGAARMSRSSWARFAFPLAGLSAAMIAHSLHNTLASLLPGLGGMAIGALFDWSGWFFMFLIILWAIADVQKRLRLYLRGEVETGVITTEQYRTACSAWMQSKARLRALLAGRYGDTSRFYQLCGELAHKKHQRARLGEEDGNSRRIVQLRAELGQLGQRALP
jgi:RsiW-degrading membrane proteinase PrsW (M82 family)